MNQVMYQISIENYDGRSDCMLCIDIGTTVKSNYSSPDDFKSSMKDNWNNIYEGAVYDGHYWWKLSEYVKMI